MYLPDHKKKSVALMSVSELKKEVVSLRRVVALLHSQAREPKVSAVDRNGKKYTRAEMVDVFERLYRESPKAIRLLFPTMTAESINKRAHDYGLSRTMQRYTPDEDAVIRRNFPNIQKIKLELIGRTERSIKGRWHDLGLSAKPAAKPYSTDEDVYLYKSLPVPGRTAKSMESRRKKLGINGHIMRAVNRISAGELMCRVEAAVSKSYPAQIRQDAVQTVMELCLAGKCWPRSEDLNVAARKAVTAVYKLHPDRGAPTSLDAQIFDDGGITVGDRIHSDAFHF